MPTPKEPARAIVPWVWVSNIGFLLAGTVFYLSLAHIMPYDELGAVVVLSAISTLVSVLFSLGLGPGLQHFLSFYRGRTDLNATRELLRSALVLSSLLTIAAAGTTLALSTLLGAEFFHSRTYDGAIALLALYAGTATANLILQSALLGLQRFVAYSVISITGFVTSYGLALSFFVTWPGVDSIVLGWIAGGLLALVLNLLLILGQSAKHGSPFVSRANPRPDPSLYRVVLAYSLPLFVSTVVSTGATYADRLVLASFADLGTVGVYNYALLLVSGSLVTVGGFSAVLIPKVSEFFGRGDDDSIRSLTRFGANLAVLTYVPLALGIAAIGPFLLYWLAGPAFVSASLPMTILLVTSAICVPYVVFGSIAAGTRRTIAFAKAAGLALLANVALSAVLIPRLGMLGAAVGNSSMVWAPLIVFTLELRSAHLLELDMSSVGRIWIASSLAAVSVGLPLSALGYAPLLVLALFGVGALVWLILVRSLRAITPETAARLSDFLPKWLSRAQRLVDWIAVTPPGTVEATSARSRVRLQ